MIEYNWNKANALQELKESLSNYVKVLDSNAEIFTFSHKNLVMSLKFRGASWEIRNPLLLGVKADARLYRTLIESNSTSGEGGWEIGIIDRNNKSTNLWISKSFWQPEVKEAASTIQFFGTTTRSMIESLESLGGMPAPSHSNYRELAFHDNYYRIGLEN